MRFVIITLPPPPIAATVDRLRGPLNEAVGAREALRYPPHVTLRTGIVCPDDKANEVADEFLAYASSASSVPIRTSEVIFVTYGPPGDQRGLVGWAITPSEPLLTLHRHLLGYQPWAKGPQAEFRPHLTVAFHDIGPAQVELLRQQIEEDPLPPLDWTVDHVALYHETPEGWVEWARTTLPGP